MNAGQQVAVGERHQHPLRVRDEQRDEDREEDAARGTAVASAMSIVLKLRKRIVLTISSAGTITIASASRAARACRGARTGYRNTVAAGTPAAAGLGIPTK